ncbi:uncharacterized protein N7498_004682 [Penicillium cinerascens]|uniref:Uncharacterized protein n=1 Tax=Penicillium cinerascens TaxID=70096 RepID=A0A9W9MM30_9EURO|nr:uncharacterized protein N7498_004682 [Penicillium cinerascens]KAJ5203803.1 hypothetical protein N7498_004682 [Penicillium cinerascens]
MRLRLNLVCTMIVATVAQGVILMHSFHQRYERPLLYICDCLPSNLLHRRWKVRHYHQHDDNPNVPLIISSSRFLINTVLDLFIILRFYTGHLRPTIAIIRFIYDSFSALVGVNIFAYIAKFYIREAANRNHFQDSIAALKTLLRPSVYISRKSVYKNPIYLCIFHKII